MTTAVLTQAIFSMLLISFCNRVMRDMPPYSPLQSLAWLLLPLARFLAVYYIATNSNLYYEDPMVVTSTLNWLAAESSIVPEQQEYFWQRHSAWEASAMTVACALYAASGFRVFVRGINRWPPYYSHMTGVVVWLGFLTSGWRAWVTCSGGRDEYNITAQLAFFDHIKLLAFGGLLASWCRAVYLVEGRLRCCW